MKIIAALSLLLLVFPGCAGSGESGESGDPVSVYVAPFEDLTETGGIGEQVRYAVADRVRTNSRLTRVETAESADLVVRGTVESAMDVRQADATTMTVIATEFTVENGSTGRAVVGPVQLIERRPEGLRAAIERTSWRIQLGVSLYVEGR